MKYVKLDFKDIYLMHQNDRMQRERATAILLIFRHPLLKLEKNESFEQPSEPKKCAYHGRNFIKVHFMAVRAASRSVLA